MHVLYTFPRWKWQITPGIWILQHAPGPTDIILVAKTTAKRRRMTKFFPEGESRWSDSRKAQLGL
jgi:hypothetical protein